MLLLFSCTREHSIHSISFIMGPSSNDLRMYCDRFENQAEEPVPKGVTLAKASFSFPPVDTLHQYMKQGQKKVALGVITPVPSTYGE